jgi:NAD(P)H-flavin reductase
MHPIVSTDQLSPNVTRLVVTAPRIAEIRRPGQFVIVRKGPGAERIPLTIADADPGAGTITLIIQAIGKSTMDLVELKAGEAIQDVAGPLGSPTELLESGHAVCVGGGVGTAVILPIAQELQRRGVAVTSIIGGRSREWVILNSIMIDGTGMCGGCRVSIDGKTKYACVDGPEFDGHQVDFRELMDRLSTYRPFEQAAIEKREACKVPALAAAAATEAAGDTRTTESPTGASR